MGASASSPSSAARVRELRRLPSAALVPGDLVVVIRSEASGPETGAEAEVEARESDGDDDGDGGGGGGGGRRRREGCCGTQYGPHVSD